MRRLERSHLMPIGQIVHNVPGPARRQNMLVRYCRNRYRNAGSSSLCFLHLSRLSKTKPQSKCYIYKQDAIHDELGQFQEFPIWSQED